MNSVRKTNKQITTTTTRWWIFVIENHRVEKLWRPLECEEFAIFWVSRDLLIDALTCYNNTFDLAASWLFDSFRSPYYQTTNEKSWWKKKMKWKKNQAASNEIQHSSAQHSTIQSNQKLLSASININIVQANSILILCDAILLVMETTAHFGRDKTK